MTSPGPAPDSPSLTELTPDQAAIVVSRGRAEDVRAGHELYRAGDRDYEFVYVESAEVEIVRGATPDHHEEVVVITHGPGRFLGEWNMLTGQAVYLTARVAKSGRIHRLTPAQFRRLLAEEVELSDVIVRTFLARREELRAGPAASSIEILGSSLSPIAHDLRTWAVRQRLVHSWLDIDDPNGQTLADILKVGAADLPVVVTPTQTLKRATPGIVAEALGLSYRPVDGKVYDVVVVGAGPAGLAAALYGASEGLDTLLLDSVSVGGQAAASSRIENYLGFPSGIAGSELTGLGEVQAHRFGATVSTPCTVAGLATIGAQLQLALTDGTEILSRAVVIATGAAYRRLPLDRWADFEGGSIYYAATEIEARTCATHPVAVVGGANSAGQAALFLADKGSTVRLVVRGAELGAAMSAYLVERVTNHPRIDVRTATEVTALHGEKSLEAITVTSRETGESAVEDCAGLFCFIGAAPATDWLSDIARDEDGFLLTDQQLASDRLGEVWELLGRGPLPFETSIPAVFAAGDVRHGSMKRVAAAVGEGASAIRSVHGAIAGRA
jgi:thioredoxin reductase (NADPH)